MAEGNISLQADEVEALCSIYGTDFHIEDPHNRSYSIDIREGDKAAILKVTMPSDYPSSSPPKYELNAPWLKGPKRQELCGNIEEIYLENIGDSVIYLWVEQIRQFLITTGEKEERVNKEKEKKEAELLKKMSEMGVGSHDACPTIISGEIISDRKSHFQPHLAAVTSQDEVKQVVSKLYTNKKIANATHNMLAYRIAGSRSEVFLQDCDDDGETHAGGRMLHLLQIVDARNVLVVVSRWFGGILLGPDRFKHINNATRQILEQCGYIKSAEVDKDKKGKKVK
ncbi:protein IMPACT-B-like isoform X3 [Oratosquilla oratoria]|uniref:protein IMPACT-B-like isoform X3 n=1 Tax=Oratosquilla oratoria TaxID=337810 RepID=UPI003F762C40